MSLHSNSNFNHSQIISQLQIISQQQIEQNDTILAKLSAAIVPDSVVEHLKQYTKELNALLNKCNGTNIQVPKMTKSPPGNLNTSSNDDVKKALTVYIQKREDEWGFNWDFLYLKTLSFWVSDCISSIAKNMGILEKSTDYLKIKSRETKVNAAKKLVRMIENNSVALDQTEISALKEGSLGLIANQDGYLDQLLRQNHRDDVPRNKRP